MTVQVFDVTDKDNRHIHLKGLKQGAWQWAILDFTKDAKRNDGKDTPFAAGHKVDDLFFFVKPDGGQGSATVRRRGDAVRRRQAGEVTPALNRLPPASLFSAGAAMTKRLLPVVLCRDVRRGAARRAARPGPAAAEDRPGAEAARVRQVGQDRLRHRLCPRAAVRARERQGAAVGLARDRPPHQHRRRATTSCCSTPTAPRKCWSRAARAPSPTRTSRFDAEWVYYAHFYLGKLGTGSDVYKVHVKTQEGRAPDAPGVHAEHRLPGVHEGPAAGRRTPPIGRGVFNLGPCPLPGGRVAFTSTRDQVKVPRGYPQRRQPALQSWTTTARTSRRSATSTSAAPCTRSS